MGDLDKYIPKESPIVSAIFAEYKRRGDSEAARGYLGASIIGHVCDRYLWYTFRACTREDFPGRLYRLFKTGDLEEIRMAKDLRSIGCTVHEVDPETGKQFEIKDIAGHFSGHMDGCVLGVLGAEKTWHVAEYKTHNRNSYTKLIKEGVRKSKPVHFAQMQVYMHKTGMTRALYLAKEKDSDDLYAERVKYDKEFCLGLMTRAEYIITTNEAPARITERQDWYECRFCSAHSLCWGIGESVLPVPAINCRQCCHATPTMDGDARWVCSKHKRGLSMKDQASACEDHLILPSLLSLEEPTDYGISEHGKECIEFTNAVGLRWWHGGIGYTSAELRTLPVPALSNQVVAAAKNLFGAEAIGGCKDDIISRYPRGDVHVIWEGEASQLFNAWRDAYHEGLPTLKPIRKLNGFDCQVAEFEWGDGAGRIAIVWPDRKAEIREGKE